MSANNGLTGALETTTLPIAMTISAFTAIAWYLVIDLNVVIWMTFKRRHGLYFYSLLCASWGIALFALAFLMKFFNIWKNPYISCTFITIGWYAMVTGQSLVLYSRLHLVVHDKRNIRWVLYMIITSVVLFHFPTTVMTFGVSAINHNHAQKSVLSMLLGKFRQGRSLCHSILDHGEDSSHSLLHTGIYHLRPLYLRNTTDPQARRNLPEEAHTPGHDALNLRQRYCHVDGHYTPRYRVR